MDAPLSLSLSSCFFRSSASWCKRDRKEPTRRERGFLPVLQRRTQLNEVYLFSSCFPYFTLWCRSCPRKQSHYTANTQTERGREAIASLNIICTCLPLPKPFFRSFSPLTSPHLPLLPLLITSLPICHLAFAINHLTIAHCTLAQLQQ